MGAVRADHAAGDGRHTARGCVEAVGVVCPTSRPATKCVVVRRPVDVDRTSQDLSPRTPFGANLSIGDYTLTWKAECVRCPARQAQRNGSPSFGHNAPLSAE